jgi:hypothetical protein
MTTITDVVLGFASDTTGGWVYLQTDGARHSAASDVILHMLMVASAHQTPVQISLDAGGTITSVNVMF